MINNNLKILLLLVGLGLMILLLLDSIGFDGLYGQDAYEYIRQARETKSALLNFSKPQDFYWAPGYPIALGLLDLAINNMVVSAQLMSVIVWSLTLFACWKVLTLFESTQFSFVICIIASVGFSAYFFRICFTSMSDGLTTLFVTLTFYKFFQFETKRETKSLYWIIVFAALSVFTRYAAFPLILIPACFSFWILVKQKEWKFLFFGGITTVIFSTLFVLLKDTSPNQILGHSIVKDWSIANYWKSSFKNEQGNLKYALPNIIYALYPFGHLGFLWLTIPILLLNRKISQITKYKWVWISLGVYLLFIAGIPFQNKRFLVLTVPLVFMALIPSVLNLMARQKKRIVTTGFLGILVANLILSVYSFEKVFYIQQQEQRLYAKISTFEIERLNTFEVDLALKQRGFKGVLINLWKVDSVEPQHGDYFLINSSKWGTQWNHHQLMKNVNKILSFEGIELVEEYENGWQLWLYE
ncbi:hypothetical protein [Parvicella tangerina]|uniref:Uncharacterized protein n=1 Tax=Parvicella tangerina TaxID=2829795 RepID=A0A916NUA0_9FLAO|nr:hypothetical protein [Parvicella tangerina]CAG5087802.1 hypothetical protein CRYO30217_03585 [Parvicella tangerina]